MGPDSRGNCRRQEEGLLDDLDVGCTKTMPAYIRFLLPTVYPIMCASAQKPPGRGYETPDFPGRGMTGLDSTLCVQQPSCDQSPLRYI
jgi:hypothetical protein